MTKIQTNMDDKKMKYTAQVEKLEGSKVKAMVTIAKEDFETLRAKAVKKVLSEVKMDGFRDGKVPESMFIKTHGEFPIRQEMGYMAVDMTYIQVIISEKIEAIGRPELAIEELSMDKDFVYSIITDVLPKIELGDYKKYHTQIQLDKIEEATDDEVNNALEELRRMRMTKVKNQDGTENEELPEIDDAFLKSIGDFKSIDDLKQKIKDNIDGEKKWKVEEKRKGQILDLLVSESKVDVPQALIDNELEKIQQKFQADLSQMGVSFEDYLKHQKKDLAGWKVSEADNAKKQVIIQLALHFISKTENIKVSEQTVGHEVAHLLQMYKDVDPERAKAYTEEKMTNSLVAEYLFTGKVPEETELFGSHEGHNH